MVNGIVGVPLRLEVRVWTGRIFPVGMPPHDFGGAAAGDFQVCEDAVVSLALGWIGKNAEKEEHTADTYGLTA